MINEGYAVGKRIGNCPFFSAIWEHYGKYHVLKPLPAKAFV